MYHKRSKVLFLGYTLVIYKDNVGKFVSLLFASEG